MFYYGNLTFSAVILSRSGILVLYRIDNTIAAVDRSANGSVFRHRMA